MRIYTHIFSYSRIYARISPYICANMCIYPYHSVFPASAWPSLDPRWLRGGNFYILSQDSWPKGHTVLNPQLEHPNWPLNIHNISCPYFSKQRGNEIFSVWFFSLLLTYPLQLWSPTKRAKCLIRKLSSRFLHFGNRERYDSKTTFSQHGSRSVSLHGDISV